MARLQGSFLLRCWRLDGGAQRLAVEHVQSGDRTVVASLAAALGWIAGHLRDDAGGEAATADERHPAPGTTRGGGPDATT